MKLNKNEKREISMAKIRMQHNLKRKSFDELINEALDNFLNNRLPEEIGTPFEFLPTNTPNRLPEEMVPSGLWKKVIHQNLFYYKQN